MMQILTPQFGSVYVQQKNGHWINLTKKAAGNNNYQMKQSTMAQYISGQDTVVLKCDGGQRKIVLRNDKLGSEAMIYNQLKKRGERAAVARSIGQGKLPRAFAK